MDLSAVLNMCRRMCVGVHQQDIHPHVAVSVFHQQLLYTFDKQVCVSSCSLNMEETLLGELQ